MKCYLVQHFMEMVHHEYNFTKKKMFFFFTNILQTILFYTTFLYTSYSNLKMD